jgi:Fe-S-cluster containining protein
MTGHAMNSLLDKVEKRFLRGRADKKNLATLKAYADTVARLDAASLISTINALIEEPAGLITDIGKDLAPITIDKPISFSCDCCGKCCSSFRIGISWSDIRRYLAEKAFFIFPYIVLPEDRVYFQLMTKREFEEEKQGFSSSCIQAGRAINPSLVKIEAQDIENCVFFNPTDRRCTIHKYKPLECQTYPAGNVVFNDAENACDPTCFSSGHDVNLEELTSLLDHKRVPDYVLSMLYGTSRDGGWRVDFFKIALLFEQCRKLL